MGKDKSGDNLVVYVDQGEHCFSCGYHIDSPDSVANLKKKVTNRYGIKECGVVELPFDASEIIREDAMTWLLQYGMTIKEIIRFKMLWSEGLEYLIFPWFNQHELVFWQGRNFGPTGQKYDTRGDVHNNLSVIHCGPSITRTTGTVVVVEDFISAIKVSRHIDCMPMWGGKLNKINALRLSRYYKKLIVWGDYDKAQQNISLSNNYSQYFEKGSKCLLTIEDPKCYNDETIKELVNEN